jgi:small multidrug resistance family-3 protein
VRSVLLFVLTACAEIVGCYLPHLWLRHDRSAWLLIPAGASLALFAWLLTLHPDARARLGYDEATDALLGFLTGL